MAMQSCILLDVELDSMPDFALKGEDPVIMCKILELCQKEESGHDFPPSGNYSDVR